MCVDKMLVLKKRGKNDYFHQIGQLGRFGLVVAMSVHGWLTDFVPFPCDSSRGSQGSKAFSQRDITTLKKCTSKNVHHYNCKSPPPF